jgi:hypothetical protein
MFSLPVTWPNIFPSSSSFFLVLIFLISSLSLSSSAILPFLPTLSHILLLFSLFVRSFSMSFVLFIFTILSRKTAHSAWQCAEIWTQALHRHGRSVRTGDNARCPSCLSMPVEVSRLLTINSWTNNKRI